MSNDDRPRFGHDRLRAESRRLERGVHELRRAMDLPEEPAPVPPSMQEVLTRLIERWWHVSLGFVALQMLLLVWLIADTMLHGAMDHALLTANCVVCMVGAVVTTRLMLISQRLKQSLPIPPPRLRRMKRPSPAERGTTTTMHNVVSLPAERKRLWRDR